MYEEVGPGEVHFWSGCDMFRKLLSCAEGAQLPAQALLLEPRVVTVHMALRAAFGF